MLSFAVVNDAGPSFLGLASLEVMVLFKERDGLANLSDAPHHKPLCQLLCLGWLDHSSQSPALGAPHSAMVQIEWIGAAEQGPCLIDPASVFFAKLAGAFVLLQPPLQGMKAAVAVPLALLGRLDRLQPVQAGRRQDDSYLEGKDDHAVVLAAAAIFAAQALKADPLNLGG